MKVQYIGTGMLKSEDGKVFYCDYGEYGGYVIGDTGDVYEITKRDDKDYPIEVLPKALLRKKGSNNYGKN